jgi:hypothetical protein
MPSDGRIQVTKPVGLVTAPRGAVRINGNLVSADIEWSVENNALSSADTFTISFIGASLPPANNVNWFSQQKDMYVEIFAGFPDDYMHYSPSDLTKLIYGQADTIDYDIAADIVTVHGRDLTRVFIDAKTTEKFQNQTSSQIATTLATRRGLTASVTATKKPAGAYYDIEHVSLQDERTEWDILSFLAQQEGFVVYVKDQTLYFNPPNSPAPRDTSALQAQLNAVVAQTNLANDQAGALTDQAVALMGQGDAQAAAGNQAGSHALYQQATAANNQALSILANSKATLLPQAASLKAQIAGAAGIGTYPIVWTQVNPQSAGYRAAAGNVEDMSFQRTLTVSRGITVVVRSWSDKTQAGFNATYPATKAGTLKPGQATPFKGGQTFTFFRPNIDKQTALAFAQQQYNLIVQHEMKMSCRIPGDVTLNAQTIIQVSGTNTAFDQTYYPSAITRHMSFDGGFEMNVSAKNHSAISQAVAL